MSETNSLKLTKVPKTTMIDGADCISSFGTISLMVGDTDMVYISRCGPDGGDTPPLTDEQYQRVIDVIVKALGLS